MTKTRTMRNVTKAFFLIIALLLAVGLVLAFGAPGVRPLRALTRVSSIQGPQPQIMNRQHIMIMTGMRQETYVRMTGHTPT